MGFGSSFLGVLGSDDLASLAKSAAPDISSPGSPTTAMRVPTATFLVPSCAMILAKIPSSWASTSIFVLSVSCVIHQERVCIQERGDTNNF